MRYIMHLKDTVSGDKLAFPDNFDWASEELMLFQWTENNFSCDCNRSIFLWEDESKELPCNMGENQIILEKIERPDGSIVEME